jgi:hypothetical protein
VAQLLWLTIYMTHTIVWCVTWYFTGKTYAMVLYAKVLRVAIWNRGKRSNRRMVATELWEVNLISHFRRSVNESFALLVFTQRRCAVSNRRFGGNLSVPLASVKQSKINGDCVTLADEIDRLLLKRRLLTTNLRCVKHQKGDDLSDRFNIFCFALNIITVTKSSNTIWKQDTEVIVFS